MELPWDPSPLELADTPPYGGLGLGDLVKQHPARPRRVLVEQWPQPGLRNDATLPPSITGWTGTLREGTLALGERQDAILLANR
jgi:hypothetical protein